MILVATSSISLSTPIPAESRPELDTGSLILFLGHDRFRNKLGRHITLKALQVQPSTLNWIWFTLPPVQP